MSTTFEVIPVDTDSITFRQVLELSERRINSFLKEINSDFEIQLKANLHVKGEVCTTEITLDSRFEWKENEYVWFNIIGVAGGTDAYCEEIKDPVIASQNPWWRFDEMISNNKTISDLELKIEKAKSLNRFWWFRRSAGQPGIVNIAYGLISASLAELTNGFIWTDDGAWNFEKFPAEPNEFYKWYFKPELEDHRELKKWAERCLEGIEKDLKAASKT